MDPKALAVFADAARQLGADLRDEDAAEAVLYVTQMWAVRRLLSAPMTVRGGTVANPLETRPFNERCVSCGRVVAYELGGGDPHREDCDVLRAWEALELPQGHAAVGHAFDLAREEVLLSPRADAAMQRIIFEEVSELTPEQRAWWNEVPRRW